MPFRQKPAAVIMHRTVSRGLRSSRETGEEGVCSRPRHALALARERDRGRPCAAMRLGLLFRNHGFCMTKHEGVGPYLRFISGSVVNHVCLSLFSEHLKICFFKLLHALCGSLCVARSRD